jgi:hypothetical protein
MGFKCDQIIFLTGCYPSKKVPGQTEMETKVYKDNDLMISYSKSFCTIFTNASLSLDVCNSL